MIFDSLCQDRSHSVIMILVRCNSYMIVPASGENVSFYLKKQLSKWRELRVVLSHPSHSDAIVFDVHNLGIGHRPFPLAHL